MSTAYIFYLSYGTNYVSNSIVPNARMSGNKVIYDITGHVLFTLVNPVIGTSYSVNQPGGIVGQFIAGSHLG